MLLSVGPTSEAAAARFELEAFPIMNGAAGGASRLQRLDGAMRLLRVRRTELGASQSKHLIGSARVSSALYAHVGIRGVQGWTPRIELF